MPFGIENKLVVTIASIAVLTLDAARDAFPDIQPMAISPFIHIPVQCKGTFQ